MTNWHKWFAWFPVLTVDGRSIWLRHVERKWFVEGGAWWGYGGYAGRDDGYQYRVAKR